MFSPSSAGFASLRDLSDPPSTCWDTVRAMGQEPWTPPPAQRAAWWSRVTISRGSATGWRVCWSSSSQIWA